MTEPLLSASIIWKVATRIARELEEFPLICLDRFTALNEVAKLSLHAVHDRLGDITSTEASLEVIPCGDSPFSERALVSVPPLSSGATQEIGRKVDVISSAHISEHQLTSDVTKPIINIQRL